MFKVYCAAVLIGRNTGIVCLSVPYGLLTQKNIKMSRKTKIVERSLGQEQLCIKGQVGVRVA